MLQRFFVVDAFSLIVPISISAHRRSLFFFAGKSLIASWWNKCFVPGIIHGVLEHNAQNLN